MNEHPEPSTDLTWFKSEKERAAMINELDRMTAEPRRNPGMIAAGAVAAMFAGLFLYLTYDHGNLWLLAPATFLAVFSATSVANGAPCRPRDAKGRIIG